MSYKRLGDQGNLLIFNCDHPSCEVTEEVTREDGRWQVNDPFGRVLLIDADNPVVIPWCWRTDSANHFCWRHRITYEPAMLVESVPEPTEDELERMRKLLAERNKN